MIINIYTIILIYQTFCTTDLPLKITKTIIHNKKCPRFKFCFYDDEQCEMFIKTKFDDIVYNAYSKLNKAYGAMRADFFRHCVLYKIGGVYLDIKSMITKPLGSIINPDPYLKHMIDHIVNDIENNDQPFINEYEMTSKSKVLLLTDPDAFTRAINSYMRLNYTMYHKNIDYFSFAKLHNA